ncbi:MAG: rod shape-determining protein RodA [Bacteroides sp.]|nr:rod shape-determining protein RodA [Bacteroides sp.]
MGTRSVSLWKSIDRITVLLFVILMVCGWFSICGASYDYGERDFFDFSTRAGKQFVWIICSFGVGFILLMLEDRFYDTFAYLIYFAMILLLILTIFIAPDVKGSRSWIPLGPISLQPAEFAKFTTALALAKFMNNYSFSLRKWKDTAICAGIFMLPMILIILQKETGTALVYLTFFLVLYREGMPGGILFCGICAVIYFVVGTRFRPEMFEGTVTSIGEFSVLLIILLFSAVMVSIYTRNREETRRMIVLILAGALITYIVSEFIYLFDMAWVLIGMSILLTLYLLFRALSMRSYQYLLIALFTVGSVGFLFSSEYVFDEILEPHQQIRIKVVLGMEEDLAGAGYNVNQSKIAIGSGGLNGKGFLNGTQTKLKYVPEQDTDFIFCTIGEEQGFIGSTFVLLLFLALILRLVVLSERQNSVFGRVYGYSVVSIFLFHIFINIGMVLGLTPVIGIPLPFFSYGGSSLWGFTILLFVFLRIDAGQRERF